MDERGGSGASLPGRRGRLRGALPVASVIVTGGLIIVLVTTPWMVAEPMRIAAAAALTMVVVRAVARQTLLLRDRERVLWRERQLTDELTVAEARIGRSLSASPASCTSPRPVSTAAGTS